MTRDEVLKIIADAREKNERPDLRGANLRWVDLRGVDLSGANLSGVDLRGVDLRGVDLSEANGIISISPIGSRGDMLIGIKHETLIMVNTGCFWGTVEEFETAVKENHAGTKFERDYILAIALIKSYFED